MRMPLMVNKSIISGKRCEDLMFATKYVNGGKFLRKKIRRLLILL